MSARATAPKMSTLLVEHRERSIVLPAGVDVERVYLDCGDVTTKALRDYARIERKAENDLHISLVDGRLFDQAKRLAAFPFRLIVVEADLGDYLTGRIESGVHPNAIAGAVCSLLARYSVPVLFAHDGATAGKMIIGILRRLEEQRAAEAAA